MQKYARWCWVVLSLIVTLGVSIDVGRHCGWADCFWVTVIGLVYVGDLAQEVVEKNWKDECRRNGWPYESLGLKPR